MLISLNWLKSYVDIDVPVAELCDRMVMSGFEVESIEDLSATMRNVVAARILKLEKHPDADKLVVCQMLDKYIKANELEVIKKVSKAEYFK